MGKNHLFVVLLLVVGTLAEDAAPPPPPDPAKPAQAEELDPVAASTTPPIPLPADASSGLIMTEAKNEPVASAPTGPMAAPGGIGIVVENIKYKWTIVNYSHNNMRLGDALYSPQFWGPKSMNYKWQLVLYPKGYDNKNPAGVGIYVALSGMKGVTPDVKVSILNNLGAQAITFRFSNSPYHEEYAHGWPAFTQQDFLAVYKDVYVPSDRLTIEVEIIFSPSSSSFSGNCASTYDPECKKMPYGKNFHNDIYARAGQGSSSAHGAALAAHSGWLRNNIDIHPRPYTVEFPQNLTEDDMQEVIRFIYSGKIDKSVAKRMLEVAKILEMDKLQAHAEEILCLEGAT